MCLAGDGGGKGSRRRRLAGVAGAGAGDLDGAVRGDAAEEEEKRWCAGLGLGVEKGKKGDEVQCFLDAGVAGAVVEEAGGGVAGAACGGEASASWVSGLAWQPPMARGRDLDRAGWRARASRGRSATRPWRRGERECFGVGTAGVWVN